MTTVRVGVRLTSYTSDDEKWVIQTVSKYQKHGISLKKLCRVSLQLHNTHRWYKQMSEMPPGREKITEIVRKGNGIHWKVEKSAGGKRGGTHMIHPLKINHLRAVERITYGLSYGTMIEKLNFDTIYHEHLCYYTLRSLNNLLAPYDLKIFDA